MDSVLIRPLVVTDYRADAGDITVDDGFKGDV